MSEHGQEALIPIFDGHNDTILDIAGSGRSFYERSERGHLDRVRAKEGGLIGGFFAVFVPDPKADAVGGSLDHARQVGLGLHDVPLTNAMGPSLAYAQQLAMQMVGRLLRIEGGDGATFAHDDALGQPMPQDVLNLVQSAAELEENIEEGRFSGILHFEGAEMIDEHLYALETFHAAGLRSLGITWSRSNIFAHGVPFGMGDPDTGPGLTDLGKNLVKGCNELGIMIDLSHLNEKGFWDVAALTDAPLVATHSNVHAICPSTRNLTDKQLDAIAESDGIVGINFNCGFLRPDGERNADTSLEVMADHIDYLVERIGIDRVALGSDFDGALMPNDLSDASKLPNLIKVLRARGYDAASLEKIGYRNWLRVLALTWGV
jgi:membrane dipeptidase